MDQSTNSSGGQLLRLREVLKRYSPILLSP